MGPKKDKSSKKFPTSSDADNEVGEDPKVELSETVPSTSRPQVPGPANWETVYANIQEMRKDRTAAVDTMGCERCHDDNADEKAI